MSQDILLLTALVAVILMGSAMCSGIEAALLAVNPLRVHELARRKPKVLGARRLEKLRHRIGRTLTVVTIANNSFNIFGSLMVGSYATYIFQDRIGNVKPIFFCWPNYSCFTSWRNCSQSSRHKTCIANQFNKRSCP